MAEALVLGQSSDEVQHQRQVRLGSRSNGEMGVILVHALAWIIHEGLGMMASRVASQLRLDWRSR